MHKVITGPLPTYILNKLDNEEPQPGSSNILKWRNENKSQKSRQSFRNHSHLNKQKFVQDFYCHLLAKDGTSKPQLISINILLTEIPVYFRNNHIFSDELTHIFPAYAHLQSPPFFHPVLPNIDCTQKQR